MTDRTKDPNTGHGHVYPRPDGVKARCGGPAICSTCAADAARKATFDAARERQESERSTPPPSNLVSRLREIAESLLCRGGTGHYCPNCDRTTFDAAMGLRLLADQLGAAHETSDVRDAFNAGVTQAKYRRYYYEALLRVLNSDRMLSHDIARAAVDGSPEHSPVETAERRDYAAVRDAHDRTVEELERYKKALYTANGFLIQRGWEPVKLEYSEGNACPDCQGHGWRRRAFTADDAGECPTCAGSGRLGGPSPLKAKGPPDLVEVMVGGAKLTVAVEPKSTAIPDCEPGCDCDFCHAPPVKASAPLDREAVNATALECARASAVVRERDWHFDRYRNGRLKAQGVKVRAATEAEAWEKARSLLYIDGNLPTDELRLQVNGKGD